MAAQLNYAKLKDVKPGVLNVRLLITSKRVSPGATSSRVEYSATDGVDRGRVQAWGKAASFYDAHIKEGCVYNIQGNVSVENLKISLRIIYVKNRHLN